MDIISDYSQENPLQYFWRTSEAREIDYLEEFDGNLLAYEFKWDPERKVSFPKPFECLPGSENRRCSKRELL